MIAERGDGKRPIKRTPKMQSYSNVKKEPAKRGRSKKILQV